MIGYEIVYSRLGIGNTSCAIFITATLTTSANINSVIAVVNQRLYLLNQLRKQGLYIRGVTQIFIELVVPHFQYALPVIAGQISVNDFNRIDAVFFKSFQVAAYLHSA